MWSKCCELGDFLAAEITLLLGKAKQEETNYKNLTGSEIINRLNFSWRKSFLPEVSGGVGRGKFGKFPVSSSFKSKRQKFKDDTMMLSKSRKSGK
jgi:hypothetical protein